MNTFYSIIVPVYRVEHFISRCIESVLHQTFKDFELILIDDGSPDKSGKICDEYAETDSRIKVIHTANRGVSCARNTGIACASGIWLFFLDADDSLYGTEVLSLMHKEITSTDADLYQHQMVSICKGKQNSLSVPQGIFTVNGKAYRKLKPNRGAAYNYIFSNKIVQQYKITFPETSRVTEDQAFTYSYMVYCDKIKICNVLSYAYYVDENPYNSSSSIHSKKRFQDAIGHINAISQIVHHLAIVSKNKAFINERIAMLILYLITLSTYLSKDERASIRKYLKEQVPFCWGYLRNNKFLFVAATYLNVSLAITTLKLYKKVLS